MKTIVTIEARMGSSRLPGKVLMEVCGKPMLQHMIERVKRAVLPDDVVVASTINPKDDPIEVLCRRIGCSYYRGSEEDITDRLIQTARHHHAHVIVQTTGDCPLHDPDVIDEGIRVYRASSVQYVSNRLNRSWPVGLDTQVYHRGVLEEVARRTMDPEDREHGSYYIYTHPREFTMKNYAAADINCPAKRWCLDYLEDFEFFKAVYERLYPRKPDFTTKDVLALLEAHPEIETINAMHPVDITVYPHSETVSE
jgi:spore coat polysaccharide biosynthesis protein SpsF